MQDLFYLHCLLAGVNVNLAGGLALYFLGTRARQQRGQLHGGAYVARIAHSLGLLTPQIIEEHFIPPVQPFRMGRSTLAGMELIMRVGNTDAYRWSLGDGVEWVRPAADEDQGQAQHGVPPPPPPRSPPPRSPSQPHRPVYRSVRLPDQLQDSIRHILQVINCYTYLHYLLTLFINIMITGAAGSGTGDADVTTHV